MDVNNTHNQSYWFVVREDHSNVIFSSNNNFTIQTPQIAGQEARFIVDTGDNRQFMQVDNITTSLHEDLSKDCCKDNNLTKEGDNFWDRNKVKLLLTLCLENGYNASSIDKFEWNEIALLVGTSPEECDKKFRNLRRTYIRLMKKKLMGKDIKWIHFNICEDLFKDCKMLTPTLEPWEDAKVRQLLNLYIDNVNKFRDPNYLQKDVWKDIASQLHTTEYNCYHKFKNLKRTYFNWLERSRETGKMIKWPYHHYFERIFYNYNPELGPWDRNKIKLLINAYSELANMFRNPKFQKKELWREISRKVGESPSNCDRKFRNLKQTYIRLKMRADTGRSITKWRYYKDFSTIFDNETYSVLTDGLEVDFKTPDQNYIKQLLNFYIENKEKFKDPLVKKKNLWRMIGPKLGLSPEECDKKFRNLKQTYIRLAERNNITGRKNGWPYYSYFERIYDEPQISGTRECGHNNCNIRDTVTLKEIRSIVRNAYEVKENDKFDKLVKVIEDSNDIQRERNKILRALLDRKKM